MSIVRVTPALLDALSTLPFSYTLTYATFFQTTSTTFYQGSSAVHKPTGIAKIQVDPHILDLDRQHLFHPDTMALRFNGNLPVLYDFDRRWKMVDIELDCIAEYTSPSTGMTFRMYWFDAKFETDGSGAEFVQSYNMVDFMILSTDPAYEDPEDQIYTYGSFQTLRNQHHKMFETDKIIRKLNLDIELSQALNI